MTDVTTFQHTPSWREALADVALQHRARSVEGRLRANLLQDHPNVGRGERRHVVEAVPCSQATYEYPRRSNVLMLLRRRQQSRPQSARACSSPWPSVAAAPPCERAQRRRESSSRGGYAPVKRRSRDEAAKADWRLQGGARLIVRQQARVHVLGLDSDLRRHTGSRAALVTRQEQGSHAEAAKPRDDLDRGGLESVLKH